MLTLHGLPGLSELHGAAIGESVLVAAGRRIAARAEDAELVARLGADRFAVLLPCSGLRAYPRAARLVAALTEPYALATDGPARLGADAGVTDLHGATAAGEVLRHARVAADRAHSRGAGRVEAYDEGLATWLRRRAAIEQKLSGAIESGAFDLVYQPMLDLRHRQPVAVEALLRWRLPDLGAVSPAEVLAAAEQVGCVADLDGRVLRRACRQLARWRQDGYDLRMAVNVAPLSGHDGGLPDLISDALRRNSLPADRLIVEIAARDVPDGGASDSLAALRATGVKVALDHFGTGTLGLAGLPRLPVDIVKFDRSLYADPSTALVDVVVGLGGRLGFEVAAVGVETDAELAALSAAGCHTAQGRVLAPPAHHERVEAYLDGRRNRRL